MTEPLPASPAQAPSGAPVDVAEDVVLALTRLIELATVQASSGAPIDPQIEETVAVMREYGWRTGQGAAVLFAHGAIFVNGRLLRASRAVYERCLAVGQVLDRSGIAEIALAKDVLPADLRTLASLLGEFHRAPEPVVPERITPRVRLRPVNDAARRHEVAGEQQLAPEEAIVHTYASAIVLMRRFFEGLRRGRYILPRRFKRIAQRLVDLSAGGTPAFLGVTAARNANHDDAGRAVNTAVLSLAMARQITSDVVLLERLAMASLLYDTARPRLTGALSGKDEGNVIMPSLTEQQEVDVPAGTAVVLTALGRLSEEGIVRTVLAYESHWVRRHARLGQLYRGLRQPALLSRIVAVARSFNDLLTPAAGREPLTADGAVAKLEQEAETAADRTVLRLLVGALGIFPTGTLVELSTGEVALVVQTPSHPSLYSQPRVRLIFDASGGPFDHLVEIDLAQGPAPGEPARHVKRVVATSDDASASTMRSFASAPSPSVTASGSRSASGYVTQRSRTHAASSARVAPAPPPKPEPELEAPDSETSSMRPGPTAPPTPPTIPTSSPSGRREIPPDTPPPEAAGLKPRLLDTAAVRAEIAAPPSDPDGGAGPVTREQAWHDKAYLLSIEAAEAQRFPGDEPPPQRPEIPATPTAEGTLVRTPLVHLLVYMLDRHLTGTTLFMTPDGVSHGIFFNDGVPSKVRTGTLIAPLDRILIELGLIDESVLQDTLVEVLQKKLLHGRHLVEKGLIDAETMTGVLSMQLVRKMLALFEMPSETRFAYYDGLNLLAAHGGPELFPCEPLAVIMAGIRLRAHDPLINATLERIGGRGMMLHPEGDIRRFRFHRDETAVADLIRGQRLTLPEILTSGVAHERTVRLTIYALAITRHLEVGVTGRQPVGLAGRDGDDPVSLRGSPLSFRSGPGSGREPPRSGRSGASSSRPGVAAPASSGGAAPPVNEAAAQKSPPPPAVRAGAGSSPGVAAQARPPSQTGAASPRPAGPPRPSAPSGAAPIAVPAAASAPGVAMAHAAERPASTASAAVQAASSVPGASPAPAAAPIAAAAPAAATVAASAPATATAAATAPASGTVAASAPVSASTPAPTSSPEGASSGPVPRPRTGFGLTFGQLSSKRGPSSSGAQPGLTANTSPTSSRSPEPQPAPAREATRAPAPAPAQSPPPAAAASTGPTVEEHLEDLDDEWDDVLPESPSRPAPIESASAAAVSAPASAAAAVSAPASAAAVVSAPALRAPAVRSPQDLAARRAEIERRAAAIDDEDHFQVLGVKQDSSSSELQAAYFALAKTYHPDRLPPELADMKPVISRVFTRVTEAYRTLSDPARRREYLRNDGPGSANAGDERDRVARVVDAALEFQKAEVLLKKNDLAGAEALARKAVEADPDQPDHVALLVWIQAQTRPNPPALREGAVTTYYDDLIKVLDGVIAKEPRFERALFYRGTLLKRAGRHDKALADFRLVAEINPRNIDAAREVRLHEMRMREGGGPRAPRPGSGASGPDAPEGQGLINKIFKR